MPRRLASVALRLLSPACLLSLLSASVASAQARPPVVRAHEVRVQGPPGSTLHEGPESCSSPCELYLAERSHRFGVSLAGGEPRGSETITIDRPGLLRIEHLNRRGARKSGWSLFAVAMTLTAGFGVTGMIADAAADGDALGLHLLALATYGAAIVNVAIAVLIGLPLAAFGDGASVRFE